MFLERDRLVASAPVTDGLIGFLAAEQKIPLFL
jgi:hypothetical protein